MMGRKQFSYLNLHITKSLFIVFIFFEKLVKITLAEFF